MKRQKTVLVAVLVLVFAGGAFGAFEVGQSVAARWSDGNMYLAVIRAIVGDSYKVDYADGDKGTVTKHQMVPLKARPDLKAGDRVMAVWTRARFYSGVVNEVQGGGVIVKWDDGSRPSFVAFGKVYKRRGGSLGANIRAGRQVMAKWRDGNWYLATIRSEDNGKYQVDYADGDKGVVTSDQIRRIPHKPNLSVGDKVWAVWTRARFYSGTVKEVRGDGVVVRWDDGSSPSFVAFGKVRKM